MSPLLEELRDALQERYLVESEVGRGGMATVFVAEDLKHGRRVAIKVLSPEMSLSIDGDRFKREIQIAARLSHPHILPVFDSDEVNGLLYYTMPFVEGESLRARLERESQLGIDDAVAITCEVADGLSYAHSLGVIHRDIKPENILLHGGHAVVADFGIARVLEDSGGEKLTQTGMSIGTAAYMSPEQFAGTQVDGRSDMYSLACVLYEMLVGEVPFTGPNAMAIMARHTMEAVPSIRVVRNNVPDALEDVIMCALEKVPSDRYATVAQFKDAVLNGFATGSVGRHPSTRLTARTASRAAAAGQATRRRRRLAYGATAILFLAVGAYGVARYYRTTGSLHALPASASVDLRRLAVLYLDDRSRDSSLHDVAAGMTTSLIDQLRRVDGLQVISAEGVAPFAHADVTDDSIARALKVGLLVRGGVETQGDNLHVSLRLIDGLSGATFKSEGFNVKKGAFLTARDSLVQRVADVLRDRLGQEVQVRQLENETKSPEAWALVQRGQNVRTDAEHHATAGDMPGAAQRFAEADSLALAASHLDDHWAQPLVDRAAVASDHARLTKDPKEINTYIDSGLANVAGALAMDPRNANALEMRAKLTFYPVAAGLVPNQHDIDVTLDRAEKDLRDVVTFSHSQASAWYQLSLVEFAKKNVPEAMVDSREAYEADAYLRQAPLILSSLFNNSYNLEQFTDAIRWCDEGRRRFPTNPAFVQCRLYLMLTKAVPPDPDDAWREVQAMEKLSPPASRVSNTLQAEVLTSIVLDRAKLADSAHRVLARTDPPPGVDSRGEILGLQALAHTFFGEPDTAITLLDRYLTSHPEHRAGFGKANFWWWRPLQQNPRFKTLVASGR